MIFLIRPSNNGAPNSDNISKILFSIKQLNFSVKLQLSVYLISIFLGEYRNDFFSKDTEKQPA